MRIVTLLPVSFILTVLLSLVGAFLKITHAPGADGWLAAAMGCNILFVILALLEIRRSPRIPFHEKTMWTIGLILFSSVTGLVYLILGRKRIAGR